MNNLWSPEVVDELKKHVEAGMTCGQIVSAMRHKFTRNAIMGKINRLGLKLGQKTGINLKPAKPDPVARALPITRSNFNVHPKTLNGEADHAMRNPPNTIHLDSPFWKALPDSALICVEELSGVVCHWPIGVVGTDEFRYCGAACGIGMTYCPTHKLMGTANKVCGGMSRYEAMFGNGGRNVSA